MVALKAGPPCRLSAPGASWNLFKMKAHADATPRPATEQHVWDSVLVIYCAIQSASTRCKLKAFQDDSTSWCSAQSCNNRHSISHLFSITFKYIDWYQNNDKNNNSNSDDHDKALMFYLIMSLESQCTELPWQYFVQAELQEIGVKAGADAMPGSAQFFWHISQFWKSAMSCLPIVLDFFTLSWQHQMQFNLK